MEYDKRLVELSWLILELKLAYYRPDLLHSDWKELAVADTMYDKLESEYRKLCEELGVDPTSADMVGFDLSRPSCQLVARKLGKAKAEK